MTSILVLLFEKTFEIPIPNNLPSKSEETFEEGTFCPWAAQGRHSVAEFEGSAEDLAKKIEEALESKKASGEGAGWGAWVAHSILILGLLSAVGALFANITAQEALFARTEEILKDSARERDLITHTLLKSKHEILFALGKLSDETDAQDLRELEAEITKLEEEIAADEAEIRTIAKAHHIFAIAVTLLAIAITLSSISIVLKHRPSWIAGLAIGAVGIGFMGVGFVTMLL